MTLQITVTSTDPNEPTEVISVMTPTGDDGWKYTDVDGDRIAVFTADINGTPGVYFKTDANGSSIPLADLEQFIGAVRATAERAARTGQEG